jgi:hypothetical protein
MIELQRRTRRNGAVRDAGQRAPPTFPVCRRYRRRQVSHGNRNRMSASGSSAERRRPALGGELEPGEFKCGCNRTADQCPRPEALGRLPRAAGHYGLRPFAGSEIGPQPDVSNTFRARDLKHEGGARIPVPDFRGIEAVPVRALAARQQIIHRARSGATALSRAIIPERLAEMPALGVRPKFEKPDHMLWVQR